MKKLNSIIIAFVIAALILTGAVPSFADDDSINTVKEHEVVPAADIDLSKGPKIEATSGILMDARTGQILYEKDAYKQRDPASVTKIATCMVVLNTLDLDHVVTVNFQPTTEGSTLKLKVGEKMTVHDMLYGLMLKSGNDAAEVLAVEAGGSIENFAEMMNDFALSCGAENTHFKNPNGLNPEAVNNVTTAYDLALMAKEAMKNETFREIVSTAYYYIPATNMTKKRRVSNSNRCLNGHKKVKINGVKRIVKDDRCIGVKTGYTSTAGDCFVGEAVEGNTYLISVVLNSPHETNRFVDTLYLWDYGFGKYETFEYMKAEDVTDSVRVTGGNLRSVEIGLDEDVTLTVNKGEADASEFSTEIEINEEKPEAPIKKGRVMGQLIVYNDDGEAVKVQDMVALEDVEEGGPLSRIGIADEDIPIFMVALTAALIIIVGMILYVTGVIGKKRRRRMERERRRQLRRQINKRNM